MTVILGIFGKIMGSTITVEYAAICLCIVTISFRCLLLSFVDATRYKKREI